MKKNIILILIFFMIACMNTTYTNTKKVWIHKSHTDMKELTLKGYFDAQNKAHRFFCNGYLIAENYYEEGKIITTSCENNTVYIQCFEKAKNILCKLSFSGIKKRVTLKIN